MRADYAIRVVRTACMCQPELVRDARGQCRVARSQKGPHVTVTYAARVIRVAGACLRVWRMEVGCECSVALTRAAGAVEVGWPPHGRVGLARLSQKLGRRSARKSRISCSCVSRVGAWPISNPILMLT